MLKLEKFPKYKYDWDLLFDGGVWLTKEGQDFFIRPHIWQIVVLGQAKSMGIKVRTSLRPEGVIIQALPNA